MHLTHHGPIIDEVIRPRVPNEFSFALRAVFLMTPSSGLYIFTSVTSGSILVIIVWTDLSIGLVFLWGWGVEGGCPFLETLSNTFILSISCCILLFHSRDALICSSCCCATCSWWRRLGICPADGFQC